MPVTIAGVRVWRIVEFVTGFDPSFYPEASPAAVADVPELVPDFVTGAGNLLMSFQSFVLETERQRILVDTCSGNDRHRPTFAAFDEQRRPFLVDLTAAGFPPESFDIVVCTHLHVDHVGWNTRPANGRWVPTFPNARYRFGAADIAYWAGSDDPLHGPAFVDAVQPVLDAGLVDPVDAETELADGVTLQPTPGHTPGHLSVWIGQQGVITGDVVHHPIQFRHPDWTATGDVDPDLARATRRVLLDTCASTGALLLGTHFAGPGGGWVEADGGTYCFSPQAVW